MLTRYYIMLICYHTMLTRFMVEGASFKPSAKKGHKEVEFVPTNLHVQQIWSLGDGNNSGQSGNIIMTYH